MDSLRQAIDALSTSSKDGSLASQSANYQTVIDAIKGSNEDKILACLTLPQYYASFPSLQDAALNGLLDLIEDADQSIRIKAINQLKTLGQSNPSVIPRVADVLTQLFVSEEKAELSQVHASFDALLKIDAVSCLIVLLNQIMIGDEKTRKLVFDYFTSQMRTYHKSQAIQQLIAQATPSQQAELANKVKTCFTRSETLTINEFKQLFTFLLSLKFLHADSNLAADLTAILHNQSISQAFDVSKESTIDGWLAACRCIQSTKLHPVDRAPFMQYFVNQIAPVFSQLTEAQRLNISRSLPSIAQSNNRSVDSRTLSSFLDSVWSLAQQLIPAANESFAANEVSRLRFGVLEGLLVACHLVAAQSPDAAKSVLGLFVATGQPGEFTAESKKAATGRLMTSLIAGLNSWSANIKGEINAAQAKVKSSGNDADAKKAAKAQVGQFHGDFKVFESLLAMASAFNEKLPSFLSTGAASWRRESKDTVREKKSEFKKGDNQSSDNKRTGRGQQAQQSNQSTNQSTNQPKNNKRKSEGGNDNNRNDNSRNEHSAKKHKGDHRQQQHQQQQPQVKRERSAQSNNQSNNQPINPLFNPAFNPMAMAAMNPMMMQAAMMAQMQQFYQQQAQGQQQPRMKQEQNNQSNQSSNQRGGQQGGRKRKQ